MPARFGSTSGMTRRSYSFPAGPHGPPALRIQMQVGKCPRTGSRGASGWWQASGSPLDAGCLQCLQNMQ
ncbi:hypothetical protein [Paraburkholderia sacchari]|uniref:hypothetical protein n=1 Tax=Paraburkholderia sacchari TaxID=159450 RepID=UPI001BCD5C96|nr:hypothetical protein [Paraburkholderia sacchari]